MPFQRKRGACLQCARKKRKCDHKWPQCTQCAKHKQTCQLQNFKDSTPSIRHRGRGDGDSSPRTQSSARSPEGRGARTLPDAPLQSTLPVAPVMLDEDDTIEMPLLANATEAVAEPDFGDASMLGFPLRSPASVFSFATTAFSAQGDVAMTMSAPSQAPFVDGVIDLLPLGMHDAGLEDDDITNILPTGGELMSPMRIGNGSPYPNMTLDHVYCPMPWPSDMLASSDRRFLWQYFLGIAESDFLCLDWDEVGHLYGFQHPYITTLPQMALANDALRAAVFCFTASQYELRHGDARFRRTKALTGSEAALALTSQAIEDTDDSDMLARISAATLLHYFGTERGEYLGVASRLVSKYISRSKAGRSAAMAPFPEVPLTEFRWSVISTLCSLYQPTSPFDPEVCRMIEMSQREIEQNYSRAFERWVSHPIYTFSPRLVNPLLKIGLLLETLLLQRESTDAQTSPGWAARVGEAEDLLLEARDRDMKVSRSTLGSADPAAVLALNESMYAAASILLYARVHGMPPTAPFIRRQTQIVSEEIAKVPASSHVSFSIVFPLFIAGCEAVEQHIRDAIVERLRELGGVTYDRGDLGGALHHIWGIRDLEPGLPWPHWANKLDSRHRISCLM